MILTDTHTHLYYHAGSPEMAEQMQRCFDNNITRFFLPNVDLKSVELVMRTVSSYPENCFPMLGLHPCSVQDDYLDVLATMEAELSKYKIYAIGEIGLDLYWDKTTLAAQQQAFLIQLNWARKLDLPIVIHCRDAFDELFELLEGEKERGLKGVLHCFTGNLQQAQQAIDLGLYLGIGGVVTFKNAGLDKVVKEIGLEHILLETDAPYLAPQPFRGKPNESSYLRYVAQKVADLHQRPIEDIAAVTTQNSINIFRV